jgi:hypothetical protein
VFSVMYKLNAFKSHPLVIVWNVCLRYRFECVACVSKISAFGFTSGSVSIQGVQN